MPTSKKPRKHRREAKSYASLCRSHKQTEKLQATTVNYELLTELKLPAGKATASDLSCLQQIINHAMTDLILHDEYTAGKKEALESCGWALRQVMTRGFRTSRFVATGDELNSIRDGIAVAGKTLKDGYEKRSCIMVNEFRAMKAIIRERKDATVPITKREIVKKMQRLAGQPWR